jgi:hypothetical protein
MNKLKEHIANIKELIALVQLEISPHLEQTGSLEKEQKQLMLLEKHIQALEKYGDKVKPELKEQKIKLVLRIDEIENAVACARELNLIGSLLSKRFADFNTKSTTPGNSKIVNQFDGLEEHQFGAFKVDNLLKRKIKTININDLVKIINAACKLNGDHSIYVFNGRMVSKYDLGFHEAFYKSLEGRIVDVLRFNNVTKLRFTLSDALKYYVNYTLKRDQRGMYI